jgi:signal recognition particle subunit SRP54
MFDNLGNKLTDVFKKMRGQGAITEKNIQDALRDVKMALLEADANFKVVKEFTSRVKEKALGETVLRSVQPGQQFIKIVNDELVDLLGGEAKDWSLEQKDAKKPGIVMMLGLQGSGKTTFCGKLARRFKKQGKKPMLVACDIYRPAAINQLEVVGNTVGVPVFQKGQIDVQKIAKGAFKQAKEEGCDVLIFDTAGRLHIDEVKMDELTGLKDQIDPDYTFLVADAMTGQDAVNSAEAFNSQVGIDGVCLTKMDGDARGGAALSINAVTGKPITFIGVGEKPEDLEVFRPEGIVSRILGMGDVVSLVEQAQEVIDEEEAEAMAAKMRKQQFSLGDFLTQLQRIKKMGSITKLMGLIPGMGNMKNLDVSDKDLGRIEAMILSMTPDERENPDILDGSRRKRVAKGSGSTIQDINGLLQQFQQMKKMMSSMMGMMGSMPAMAQGGVDAEAIGEMGQQEISNAMSRHAKATMHNRKATSSRAFAKKKAKKKAQKKARKKR